MEWYRQLTHPSGVFRQKMRGLGLDFFGSGQRPTSRGASGWHGVTREGTRKSAQAPLPQAPARPQPSPGLGGLDKFRAQGMDAARATTKDTRLPMGQGDALGRLPHKFAKEVGTPYRGLEFRGGEPAMFGPVPQYGRSDWGPTVPGKSPYLGLQGFGAEGIPYRPSGLDLPADFSPREFGQSGIPSESHMKPAQEIQYDDVIYEPVSRWDLMEQDYRNQRGDALFPLEPQQPPAAGLGDATAQPLRPARTPEGVPIRPGMRTATGPNDPVLGVSGSKDVTGLNLAERLEVERQMQDPDRRRNLALDHKAHGFTQEELDALGPGIERNEALNKSTFREGYTRGRGPGGQIMERVHPVGLMGGGVKDEDRARTYYNRHTGRWTEPPKQMTEEERAARFSRSAAAAGLTEGEDGRLTGAGKGTGALPEVRRAALMLLEDNPGMTDAEVRAALKPDFGADADRFGSIRLLKRAAGREERAAQARQERMASPAGQRAMVRGGFSPMQARALAGDAEATRALNLGQAGLSSVMQEEERQRGTAETAGIAADSAERVEQIRGLAEQGKIDSALEIAKLNNAAAVQKIELMLPYLRDKEEKAMLTAALPAIFASPDPEAALNQFMAMMGFADGTIGGNR